MALMSGNERFNAIMNGEDIDSDIPSIDVEINVIQKEIEAEEDANEMNDLGNDIETASDTVEEAEDQIEEAEMLIDILRTDGVNPVALKILSANRVYTEVWRIGLPSTEALDPTGANRAHAEMIAAGLEEALAKAKAGVSKALKFIGNKIQAFIDKFVDRTKSYDEKCTKLAGEIEKVKDWDDDKIEKMGEIDAIPATSIGEFNKKFKDLHPNTDGLLKKAAKGLLSVMSLGAYDGSTGVDVKSIENELKWIENMDVKPYPTEFKKLATSLKGGTKGLYYTNVKEAATNHVAIKETQKSLSEMLAKAQGKEASKLGNLFANKYIKKIANMTLNFQRQYISLASKLLKCSGKKKEEKKEKK